MPTNKLSHYIDRYIVEMSSSGWLPRTIQSARLRLTSLINLLSHCGCEEATAVKTEHIDSIFHHMRTMGYAAATIEGRYQICAQFFAWLYKRGFILSDPMRGFELPIADEPRLPDQPLSEIQVHQLLESIPGKSVLNLRDRALTELIYSCGLRISEALGLALDEIDLDKRSVFICGKGGHERVLPLMSGAFAALQAYLALRRSLLRGPDTGVLFMSRRGRQLDPGTYRQWLQKHVCKALGPEIRVYPHLLRHSIAVHLLRGGADIRHVQAFLGHADLDTTKIYLRLYPAHLRADYDRAMPELV